MNYKPGQWIYGIEISDSGEIPDTDVSSMLFIAECGDYIIGTGKLLNCTFENQLQEMYEESVEYCTNVNMFRKEYTYATEEEAIEALDAMVTEWNKE